MALQKEVARPAKWRERRRGVRMNSRVQVALDWTAGDGKKEHVEIFTRMVSPYGCLVVIPYDFALDQKVQLTNSATHQSNLAAVVWKGNKRPDGWEFGIELVNPEMDFWGLEL